MGVLDPEKSAVERGCQPAQDRCRLPQRGLRQVVVGGLPVGAQHDELMTAAVRPLRPQAIVGLRLFLQRERAIGAGDRVRRPVPRVDARRSDSPADRRTAVGQPQSAADRDAARQIDGDLLFAGAQVDASRGRRVGAQEEQLVAADGETIGSEPTVMVGPCLFVEQRVGLVDHHRHTRDRTAAAAHDAIEPGGGAEFDGLDARRAVAFGLQRAARRRMGRMHDLDAVAAGRQAGERHHAAGSGDAEQRATVVRVDLGQLDAHRRTDHRLAGGDDVQLQLITAPVQAQHEPFAVGQVADRRRGRGPRAGARFEFEADRQAVEHERTASIRARDDSPPDGAVGNRQSHLGTGDGTAGRIEDRAFDVLAFVEHDLERGTLAARRRPEPAPRRQRGLDDELHLPTRRPVPRSNRDGEVRAAGGVGPAVCDRLLAGEQLQRHVRGGTSRGLPDHPHTHLDADRLGRGSWRRCRRRSGLGCRPGVGRRRGCWLRAGRRHRDCRR